jgi:hypothetical protein
MYCGLDFDFNGNFLVGKNFWKVEPQFVPISLENAQNMMPLASSS